tara:strand:- start:1019 stop:1519 length:501 start_codon:yes stop_codon:yes gene_type:complete
MDEIELIVKEQLFILKDRNYSIWNGSKYEEVKKSNLTVKGDFGEEITNKLFSSVGLTSRIVNKGKGDYDILINEKLKIEHKLATLDTNGSFQFNGIKKYIDYDYVFCLGVSPNKLWFKIVSLDWCNHNLSVPMSKNGDDTYKYTVRECNMIPLNYDNFKKEMHKIV